MRPKGRELTKIRKRISQMWHSKDKSLWRVAQLLCHEHRINYYVFPGVLAHPSRPFTTFRYETWKYSLIYHGLEDVALRIKLYNNKKLKR